MKAVRVLDEEGHPVVGQLLCDLRDVSRQGHRHHFRQALRHLGRILAYELAPKLPCASCKVVTPLGEKREPVLQEAPVICVILRAALPLWEGMLEVFQEAETLVIGAARTEGGLKPGTLDMGVEINYAGLVSLEGRSLIYADPMIATGSTLRAVHPLLIEQAGQPARVFVASAVAYRKALPLLQKTLAAQIVTASCDDQLNERGYIVPGLGDAGDLALGCKM